jgi:HEAT repeat protein
LVIRSSDPDETVSTTHKMTAQSLRLLRALADGPRTGRSALQPRLFELSSPILNVGAELCRLLQDVDADEDDRVWAAEELCEHGDASAVPTLLLSQAHVGTEPPRAALAKHRDAMCSLALNWLAHGFDEERIAAIMAFSRFIDGRAVPGIIRACCDREPALRRASTWALARQGCSEAGAILRNMLHSDDEAATRAAAAEALGQLGDEAAADDLATAMQEARELRVRRSAVLGLERLPGAHADGLLRDAPHELQELASGAIAWRQEYPEFLGIHPDDIDEIGPTTEGDTSPRRKHEVRSRHGL